MLPGHLLPRPAFIPPFENYACFRGLRVGITGHRGVLGGILFRRFMAAGIQPSTYAHDITDSERLRQWFSGAPFDLLFHCAALVPVKLVEQNPLAAFETNAIGTFNVCKGMISGASKGWIFLASTSHVYQAPPAGGSSTLATDSPLAPSTFYGATKLAGEQLARTLLEKLKMRYCIGRIFSFTHESQAEPYLAPALTRRISEIPDGGTLELDDSTAERDMLDAEVVVDCILHVARCRFQGIINIGSGQGVTVAELASRIAVLLHRSVTIVGRPRTRPNALVADVTPLRTLLAGGA